MRSHVHVAILLGVLAVVGVALVLSLRHKPDASTEVAGWAAASEMLAYEQLLQSYIAKSPRGSHNYEVLSLLHTVLFDAQQNMAALYGSKTTSPLRAVYLSHVRRVMHYVALALHGTSETGKTSDTRTDDDGLARVFAATRLRHPLERHAVEVELRKLIHEGTNALHAAQTRPQDAHAQDALIYYTAIVVALRLIRWNSTTSPKPELFSVGEARCPSSETVFCNAVFMAANLHFNQQPSANHTSI